MSSRALGECTSHVGLVRKYYQVPKRDGRGVFSWQSKECAQQEGRATSELETKAEESEKTHGTRKEVRWPGAEKAGGWAELKPVADTRRVLPPGT